MSGWHILDSFTKTYKALVNNPVYRKYFRFHFRDEEIAVVKSYSQHMAECKFKTRSV